MNLFHGTLTLLALVVGLFLTSCRVNSPRVLHYVDPGIGTAHSRWFFYTPAALPHGMAKLAPATNGHYGIFTESQKNGFGGGRKSTLFRV